jgi:hypothetical protein
LIIFYPVNKQPLLPGRQILTNTPWLKSVIMLSVENMNKSGSYLKTVGLSVRISGIFAMHNLGFQFGHYFEQCKKKLNDRFSHHTLRSTAWYDLFFVYIVFLITYYFLQWPVVAFDTDLWTHLNWGRNFFETGEIPSTNFYSYISSKREVTNYPWLFQIAIFKIFSHFGYIGLIILRTVIALATTALLYAYLRRNQQNYWLPILFIIYLMVFIDRSSDVRPYNFSFLFIVLYLYIIEFHARKAFVLPIVGIIWMNLHGIEYPVLVLIVLAYLVEAFYFRIKEQKSIGKEKLGYMLALVITMGSIFVTPFGVNLIKVPFENISYASLYIDELRKLEITNLGSYHLNELVPSYQTAVNICVLIFTAIFLKNLLDGKLKLSHFILFAGGVYLLTKGIRFIHEFALLALPSLHTNPVRFSPALRSRLSKVLLVLFAGIVIFVPYQYLRHLFGNPPRFPVSASRLPHGVVTFLNKIETGGRLVNHPLWPQYKIYMDMHVPFLFTDEDYFKITNAISDRTSFNNLIAEYRPDFITLPNRSPIHKHINQKHQAYVRVFFDDSETLYADRRRHPQIAAKFELKKFSPQFIEKLNWDRLNELTQSTSSRKLIQLWEIYPEGRLINQALANFHLHKKDFAKAMQRGEVLARNFPRDPAGYLVKGDALFGLKKFNQALRLYKTALDKTNDQGKSVIFKKMWACHFDLQDYHPAYRALKKTVNIFGPSAGHIDLFRFGITAYRTGRPDEALMLLRFANFKTPEDNTEFKARIAHLITLIEKSNVGNK